jgi:hypothetical protein
MKLKIILGAEEVKSPAWGQRPTPPSANELCLPTYQGLNQG